MTEDEYLAIITALIALPTTWWVSSLFSAAFGGFNKSNAYEAYRRIPANERYTGDFSPATINTHLRLMQLDYRERFRGEIQKSVVRHVGSFICVCAALYGFSTGYTRGLEPALPLISALFSIWMTSFCVVTLAKLFMYPRRIKTAKEDLLLIRSAQLEYSPDHSMKA